MDPLSIASGIIAVLTASGNTLQGLEKVWELRHRSQEFMVLWNQVSGVRTLLWGTEIALRHIKDGEQGTDRIQDCLTNIDGLVLRAIEVFAMLDKMIHEVDAKQKGRKTRKPSKRSWLYRKSKLVHLTNQVSTLIAALNTALGILQGVQNSVTAQQTALKVDLVLSKVETLVSKPPEPTPPLSLEVQIRSILDEMQNSQSSGQEATAVATQLAIKSRTISRRSSWESFHSALSTSSDSSGTLVSFSGSLTDETTCESFCPCQCHISTASRMPWWATQLFGRMTIHGNGSILLNRQPCNKKHCHQSGSAQLQISYVAPAWTLLQAFKIYVRAETIGGLIPSINMFMPRVIPNSAEIWSIIELGKMEQLRKLLAQRDASPYDVSVRGVSILKYAAIKGQNDIYSYLLTEKADPCFRDQTGLMAMQPGIDRALSGSELDRNASGTGQRSTEIYVSSQTLDEQCFTLLHLIILELQFLDLAVALKHYPVDIDAPDVNGRTPLLWAAWRGDLLSVTLLLRYGADVNKTDTQSWTPLAKASKAGHLGVVQCLLQAKASLTLATSQGFQSIHNAADNKVDGAEIVKELLARGADPNALSNSHGTPLHNAANRGSVETIECLLAAGSSIDALDDDGDTPLMTSLLCWNEVAFKYLAKAGARLDIARKTGHSAIHVAVWGASIEVWDLLTSFAEAGDLRGVDIHVPHKGHDLRICFGECRTIWYPGVRDIGKETASFERMIRALEED